MNLERMPDSRWLWPSALCLFAVQLAAFHGMRSDDAYITYRYGQNLASGFGLVFNPGQRVLGSTSPGHMLLSALVYALFGLARTPAVMAGLGCLAWSAQAVAVYRLLAHVLGPVSAAAIALALGIGVTGAAGFVSLETNLVAACVLFAFAFARERRWTAAALSCGLAVLVRPDACVAAALLLGICCWELRARALGPIGVFLAVAAPWQVFASVYYGSPLPQSAITKFQRVGLMDYLVHELSLPGQRLLWRDPGPWWPWLALALAVAGAIRLVRLERRLWPFVAYGVLHAAAYLVLRPFKAHTWHLYPWTLVFCIAVLAGVAPGPSRGRSRVEDWARGAALALSLGFNGVRFADDCRRLDAHYWTGQRDTVYRRIAEYLSARAAPGDWFASVEVGTIAYLSQLSAYDLGGLVSRTDDPIGSHPLRFLVVDQAYLQMAPPSPPVFVAREGEFFAHVYEPKGR